MQSARVVGMPSACSASPQRYSRMADRSTERPSKPRENGVGPLPLRWRSQRSPRRSPPRPGGWRVRRPAAARRRRTGARRRASRRDRCRESARHRRHSAGTRDARASAGIEVDERGRIGVEVDEHGIGQRRRARPEPRTARRAGRSCCRSEAGDRPQRGGGGGHPRMIPRHSPKPMRANPSRSQRAAHDDLVAILEEPAGLAGGQLRWDRRRAR